MSERKFRINIDPSELVPESRQRKYYALAALFILLMIVIVLLVLYGELLPSQVPLYFSLPWGEGRLVPRIHLLRLPALGAFFMLINLLVSLIARGDTVLSMALAVGTLVTVIMLFVSLTGILQSVL